MAGALVQSARSRARRRDALKGWRRFDSVRRNPLSPRIGLICSSVEFCSSISSRTSPRRHEPADRPQRSTCGHDAPLRGSFTSFPPQRQISSLLVSFCLPEMMFSSAGKRCFTIESLVAKENPLTAEDPIRPTALSYSNPTTDALMNSYQGPPARSLYQTPDLVFPETVGHPSLTVAPHQLGGSHLQHPHFFGTQHRDPLNFYPWVLRNRFFGHRFQGKKKNAKTQIFIPLEDVRSNYLSSPTEPNN